MTDVGTLPAQLFDVLIRNGSVYDGTGAPPVTADVAVVGDRIAAVGTYADARAALDIDASGHAVSPGFINVLSHSYISILQDPRSMSELKQGVTLQVFGEGTSMGPYTPAMRQNMIDGQAGATGSWYVDITWSTLAEYLAHAEAHGIAQNVASFIGATTLRQYAVGQDDRPATPAELDVMRSLVRDEMSSGALGIGSSLIYPPAFFAGTDELIQLCRAAAPYGGSYISHIRDEGNRLLEALDELITIGFEAELPAEVYHLKVAGRDHWHKVDAAIDRIESARARGQRVTADMYTYTAGATGLSAAIPPRFHDGGPRALLERLAQADQRAEIRRAIETETDGWENLYRSAGGPQGVLILGVRKPEHRRHQGQTLAQIAAALGVDPIEALMDLVLTDRSRIETAYFSMSEDNLRKQIALPWVSLGSDSPSIAAEGGFMERATHPRAYGCFARMLGKYVRQEGLVPLPDAIRRMTSLPVANFGIADRGRISEGCFADIVIFDPDTIIDRATFAEPHQYAEGVRDVFVNGVAALRDGEFTGNLPGRAVYGAGRRR
ncbi:MAG: D-aminoacylase [Chloroflexi bacterium]|nr:D-aminoacylase [Chloroflexota bacterium]